MIRLVVVLTVAAGVGSGLIAGSFFVFSVAVMPAFRRLSPEAGMAAMKLINEVILNPLFLGVFLGTGVVSLGLALWSILNWAHPASTTLLAGSLLYVVGTFGVTAAFNVPLNNGLVTSEELGVWENYLRRWTAWNHIRTVASGLALFAFVMAAREIR